MAESYPIHVVCAWIGKTTHITNKHYEVTDEHFRLGAQGGEKCGAECGAVAVR